MMRRLTVEWCGRMMMKKEARKWRVIGVLNLMMELKRAAALLSSSKVAAKWTPLSHVILIYQIPAQALLPSQYWALNGQAAQFICPKHRAKRPQVCAYTAAADSEHIK
ncbi:UNVERIFIED_CONTAM: hypothetical protein Slati_3189300 [Sesamum latifolium]|uniref:Uncharacterized protein n=1 Tax=Sesamum latifolium TaxID=2727402 RepID=A0AAW2UYF5_9LAMI